MSVDVARLLGRDERAAFNRPVGSLSRHAQEEVVRSQLVVGAVEKDGGSGRSWNRELGLIGAEDFGFTPSRVLRGQRSVLCD